MGEPIYVPSTLTTIASEKLAKEILDEMKQNDPQSEAENSIAKLLEKNNADSE